VVRWTDGQTVLRHIHQSCWNSLEGRNRADRRVDGRSVGYGLLIRTSHYGPLCCDGDGGDENHYDTKVKLSSQRDRKERENYGRRMEISM